MVAGGLLLLSKPQKGLDLVAAGMLVLLGIAIRHSWSIATTIVSSYDRGRGSAPRRVVLRPNCVFRSD